MIQRHSVMVTPAKVVSIWKRSHCCWSKHSKVLSLGDNSPPSASFASSRFEHSVQKPALADALWNSTIPHELSAPVPAAVFPEGTLLRILNTLTQSTFLVTENHNAVVKSGVIDHKPWCGSTCLWWTYFGSESHIDIPPEDDSKITLLCWLLCRTRSNIFNRMNDERRAVRACVSFYLFQCVHSNMYVLCETVTNARSRRSMRSYD